MDNLDNTPHSGVEIVHENSNNLCVKDALTMAENTAYTQSRPNFDNLLPIEKAIMKALYEADYSNDLSMVDRTIRVHPDLVEEISHTSRQMPGTEVVHIGQGRRYADIPQWQESLPREWSHQPYRDAPDAPVHFLPIRIMPDVNVGQNEARITSWLGPMPWDKSPVSIHVTV